MTNISLKLSVTIVTAATAATGVLLYVMGRVLYCACGYVHLWHATPWDSQNSQHLTDWYTFSHLIHGILFYWLFSKFWPKSSLGFRFLMTAAVEIAWEIIENTPMIIDRYRETTVSQDYYGDSIVNSLMDIAACFFGFWLARKLPFWLALTVVLMMELFVAYMIRDNLTLNVVMLIYPFQAVKAWQLQAIPTLP